VPDGLRLALTTLTVGPLRGPRTLDRRTAGQAMELAPFVGLLLGMIAAALVYGGRRAGMTSLLSATLGIAALALLTRGLHLDGLADTTDGLGSYRDPAGALAVMKAPDIGPLGVAAVVLTLLVQVTALQACVLQGRGTASLVLAVVTGRIAVTAACHGTPAATGQGLGALVAGTVRRGVTSIWAVGAGIAAAAYATLDGDTPGSDVHQALRAAAALAVGLALARVLRVHAVRRLGGMTGDVLGAVTEVATAACLVVLATSAW
jgi:adenosylcobinamide-GDP ribazoletransferase